MFPFLSEHSWPNSQIFANFFWKAAKNGINVGRNIARKSSGPSLADQFQAVMVPKERGRHDLTK